MKKKTSTSFSPKIKAPTIISIQPFLRDERNIAALKLLCLEWGRFWDANGQFPRAKMKRDLFATEDFMRSRFQWLGPAIELQRRSRNVLTIESKELAQYHLSSLFETIKTQELVLQIPPL